jgi:hypothetical protein
MCRGVKAAKPPCHAQKKGFLGRYFNKIKYKLLAWTPPNLYIRNCPHFHEFDVMTQVEFALHSTQGGEK